MHTWAELQGYVRAKYRLAEDSDERFALVFAIPGGRTQQIVVSRFTAIDREFIEFRTPVCPEAALEPRAALLHNDTTSIGALALHEGVYHLVHHALLHTLDPEELELPLHAMAMHADMLEAERTAGSDTY